MRYNPLAESNNRLPRNCAWTQARLFAYADGDLSASERNMIQAHLDTCTDCRQELALCHQAESVLTGARTAIPAPGDLRAGFYARLAEKEAAVSSRRFNPQWGVALSACAAVALFAVLWQPFQTPVMPASTPAPSENTIAPKESEARKGNETRSKVADLSAGVKKEVKKSGGTLTVRRNTDNPRRVLSSGTMVAGNKATFAKMKSAAPSVLSEDLSRRIKFSVVALAKELLNERGRSEQPAVASLEYKAKSADARPHFSREFFLGVRTDRSAYGFTESKEALKDSPELDGADRHFKAGIQPKDEALSLYALGANTQNGQITALSDSTFAEREGAADFATPTAAIVVAAASADQEEVSLEVVDEERGFRASVRHASRVESDDEGEVLMIESDDTNSDADPVSTQ